MDTMEDSDMDWNNFLLNDDYTFQLFCFSLVRNTRDGQRPKPRSGHRCVADTKGNIYCYGGYNPTVFAIPDPDDETWMDSQHLFKELWKFNIAKGMWRRLPVCNIPQELVSCCLFYHRDNIAVFGGTGFPFGAFSSNNVALCDVTKQELSFELMNVEGQLPSPQYGQGFLLDDPYFYTVGGTNGYDYSSDIHRLDLRNGHWELIYKCTGRSTEPSGRYRHELAFDGERIFLLGGGTVGINACLSNLPVFYLSSRRWDLVKTNSDPQYGYPSPRKYHSAVKLPDQFQYLVIGGYDDNEVFSDCWMIDLISITWKFLPSMRLPLGTYFHGSAVTPSGKLYTHGGVHHRRKLPERTSFMFTAWLKLPSLKDICWDAIIHYRLTETLSKTELRSLGVPLQYINEIA